MEKYIDFLKKTQLFAGITESEIGAMLGCISYKHTPYAAGQTVLLEGDILTSVGIVASGSVHIVQDDFWGNRSILAHITPGKIFGEVFAFSDGRPLTVSAVAAEESVILFFDFIKMTSVCAQGCSFHNKLIYNLLSIIIDKNAMLTKKLRYLSSRSIREKLLSYLSDESKKHKKSVFQIPFDRQELADYLLADRSALSNELSKLRNEGILRYHKNTFELIRVPEEHS